MAKSESSAEALSSPLRESWERGQEAWPQVELSFEKFASLYPKDAKPETAHADLYLALACLSGNTAAIAVLVESYWEQLYGACLKVLHNRDAVEDVLQELRIALFVEEPSRMTRYSGEGRLAAWLRVVALRLALMARRRLWRELDVDQDNLLSFADGDDDPELQTLKYSYRAAFKSAFREALESLTSRQRNLLRYSVIDGLTIDELGKLHGVHRASAARWLAAAKRDLARRTKQRLRDCLELSDEDYAELTRVVESRLYASLQRELAVRA
jgi:RNA polymerase sigma-70 factor (ECF subfamily)